MSPNPTNTSVSINCLPRLAPDAAKRAKRENILAKKKVSDPPSTVQTTKKIHVTCSRKGRQNMADYQILQDLPQLMHTAPVKQADTMKENTSTPFSHPHLVKKTPHCLLSGHQTMATKGNSPTKAVSTRSAATAATRPPGTERSYQSISKGVVFVSSLASVLLAWAIRWAGVGEHLATEMTSPATRLLYLQEYAHRSTNTIAESSRLSLGLLSRWLCQGIHMLFGLSTFPAAMFVAISTAILASVLLALSICNARSATWVVGSLLLNPIALLGCSLCSTRPLCHTLVLLALWGTSTRIPSLAIASLVALVLEDPYALLLLPSLASILLPDVPTAQPSRAKLLSFAAISVSMLGLGFAVLFPDPFLAAASPWVARFLAEFGSVEHNAGVLWYLFVETFPQFQPFHTAVALIYLACSVAVAQIAIVHPRVRLWVALGLISLWRPWATWSDVPLLLALWPWIQPAVGSLKYALLSLSLFFASTALQPILRYAWLGRGSANANYYFASALIRTASATALLVDVANRSHEQERHTNLKKVE
jgi:GPI-anchor transamidase subunit U